MDKESPKQEILDKINLLQEKFRSSGQDLSSYLEGLLYADYLTYWDYINLDTLLSLQQPKTSFKDEKIFIIYHQITELYFKLIIWELEQIAQEKDIQLGFFKNRLERVIMYFDQLISSFAVMWKGMEKEQFLKFRMSLLPASGVQSAQYRVMVFYPTGVTTLVAKKNRQHLCSPKSIDRVVDHVYWPGGATDLATGRKTLTSQHFEKRCRKESRE